MHIIDKIVITGSVLLFGIGAASNIPGEPNVFLVAMDMGVLLYVIKLLTDIFTGKVFK